MNDREPWEPPSLSLQVGDRVRVRLSGETPATCVLPRSVDGQTGVLLSDNPQHLTYGYQVQLDDGSVWKLARVELERLTWEDA